MSRNVDNNSAALIENTCKVCDASISRTAVICDACRKFYQRHCEKEDKLTCTTGNGRCSVSGTNRTSCIKCRLDKCRIVKISLSGGAHTTTNNNNNNYTSATSPGTISPMLIGLNTSLNCSISSSFLSSSSSASSSSMSSCTSSTSSNSSATTPSSSAAGAAALFTENAFPQDQQQHALLQLQHQTTPINVTSYETWQSSMLTLSDPVNYSRNDGANVEHTLRLVVQAFKRLHGLHFLPLYQTTEQIDDKETFMQIAYQHTLSASEIALSYADYMSRYDGLSSDEQRLLFVDGLTGKLTAVFLSLPGNGSMHLFGVRNLKSLLHFYPQVEEACKLSQELKTLLEKWNPNPSFIESAILLGLVYYNERYLPQPRHERIRNRLWLALDLIAAYNRSKQQQVATTPERNSRLIIERALSTLQLLVDNIKNLALTMGPYEPRIAQLIAMAMQPSTYINATNNGENF